MRYKFLSLTLVVAAIYTLTSALPDNSDEEGIQPKSLYMAEHDPVKVQNNLAGVCNKEQRILSREELYQRAIVDRMRNELDYQRKIQEKDRKNGFSGVYYEILMSAGAMTREQFIQRAQILKNNPAIHSYKMNKLFGLEPVRTIERFEQRLKETGNKLVVVQDLNQVEHVYVTDYSGCCAVLSEEEARRDGALFPDQDPSRKEYDPEKAKKSGYGLFYLRLRTEHINLYTGQYTVERTKIYNPVSNCGEIIYGFCLTQPIIGTPLKR